MIKNVVRINPKIEVSFKNGAYIVSEKSIELIERFCRKYDGKRGYITFQPYKKRKTNYQNKYYRGVVVQILAVEFSLTNEECHQYLSMKHLSYQKNGLMLMKSTSLDEWSTSEWEEYMHFLRMWASSEHSIIIPEPNEVDLDSLSCEYY